MEEKFIEEVRKRQILYDLNHPDYKKLKKKENAWREVAARVNSNETKCKKQWKMLRDSYRRCKRKCPVASVSGNDTPPKKWRYFEAMTFLDSVKSTRNFYVSDDNDTNQVFKEEEEEEINDMDYDDLDYDSCYSPPPSAASASTLRENQPNDTEIVQKIEQDDDSVASVIPETKKPVALQKQEQDSTALHFASLAAKIRDANMPPRLVNRIEAKVSALVFKKIDTFYALTKQ